MERYAVVNWTTKMTQGPYDSLDDARAEGMQHVGPNDEYAIWMMPAEVGAGTVVEEWRNPWE